MDTCDLEQHIWRPYLWRRKGGRCDVKVGELAHLEHTFGNIEVPDAVDIL